MASSEHFNFNLSSIMLQTRQLESTLPHDAVYGLYNLFRAQGLQGLPATDYERPLGDVYADYSQAVMSYDQSLELLLSLGDTSDLTGLPSWCLDWSRPISTARTLGERFSATCGSRPSVRFKQKTLVLSGVELVTISQVSGTGLPEVLKECDSEDALAALPYIVEQIRIWQDWARFALQSDTGTNLNYLIFAFGRTVLLDGVTGPHPHQQLP